MHSNGLLARRRRRCRLNDICIAKKDVEWKQENCIDIFSIYTFCYPFFVLLTHANGTFPSSQAYILHTQWFIPQPPTRRHPLAGHAHWWRWTQHDPFSSSLSARWIRALGLVNCLTLNRSEPRTRVQFCRK